MSGYTRSRSMNQKRYPQLNKTSGERNPVANGLISVDAQHPESVQNVTFEQEVLVYRSSPFYVCRSQCPLIE